MQHACRMGTVLLRVRCNLDHVSQHSIPINAVRTVNAFQQIQITEFATVKHDEVGAPNFWNSMQLEMRTLGTGK